MVDIGQNSSILIGLSLVGVQSWPCTAGVTTRVNQPTHFTSCKNREKCGAQRWGYEEKRSKEGLLEEEKSIICEILQICQVFTQADINGDLWPGKYVDFGQSGLRALSRS